MSGVHQTDMLGLVALTEQRITAALDSLGLDEPEGAALELAKALSSVRALKGEIENDSDKPDEPASPQTAGYAKAAASEHSAFHRAVAKAGLSHLFTRWLEAETRLATSLEVADG